MRRRKRDEPRDPRVDPRKGDLVEGVGPQGETQLRVEAVETQAMVELVRLRDGVELDRRRITVEQYRQECVRGQARVLRRAR